MALFDLTPHKIRVGAEILISAAIGGAITSVAGAYVAPTDFNLVDPAARRKLVGLAISGAAGGVLNLFRSIPRDPASWQRKSDPVQIAQAAVKLGIADPSAVTDVAPKPPGDYR